MYNYTIIEDCSPFYIRYTYKELGSLIDLCQSQALPEPNNFGFRHIHVDDDKKQGILDLIPVSRNMPLNQKRISLFLTEPGFYYGPHKDGLNHRFSLNFTISILDDKCVTSWYSDEELRNYTVSTEYLPWMKVTYPNISREVLEFEKDKHVPLRVMTARQNEAILFNTEIFHDFDNTYSTNRRLVLTLRHADPGNVYFEDARKIMFGY